MTLSEIPYVRPEMARPAPYRWQDNVPPGPVSRFDMNTLPLSPAAWPQIAAEVAKLPSCSYPEAVYRPLSHPGRAVAPRGGPARALGGVRRWYAVCDAGKGCDGRGGQPPPSTSRASRKTAGSSSRSSAASTALSSANVAPRS